MLDRIEYLLKEEIEAREGLLENPALFSFFGEDPASDVFEFSSFSVCEFESLASPIGSNNYSVYGILCNIILAIIYNLSFSYSSSNYNYRAKFYLLPSQSISNFSCLASSASSGPAE